MANPPDPTPRKGLRRRSRSPFYDTTSTWSRSNWKGEEGPTIQEFGQLSLDQRHRCMADMRRELELLGLPTQALQYRVLEGETYDLHFALVEERSDDHQAEHVVYARRVRRGRPGQRPILDPVQKLPLEFVYNWFPALHWAS